MTLPLNKVYKPPALSQQTFAAYSRTCGKCCDIPRSVDSGLGALLFSFRRQGPNLQTASAGIKNSLLKRKENENETND